MIQEWSMRDCEEKAESLQIAGWYHPNGSTLWAHPHKNGLHNLRSAWAKHLADVEENSWKNWENATWPR